MKLTNENVEKVAKLANLQVSESEAVEFTGQLSAILDYIDQLSKLDTSDVTPTFNVTDLENVVSDDNVEPSLAPEEALVNGLNTKNGYFVTKGVFDDE